MEHLSEGDPAQSVNDLLMGLAPRRVVFHPELILYITKCRQLQLNDHHVEYLTEAG